MRVKTYYEVLTWGNTAQDDHLKAPSPLKNGTPPRRGIVEFILALFCFITFHLF
jgi:hypothetical protein